MNKNIIIVVAIALLIVLGGGYYLSTNKKTSTDSTTSSSENITNSDNEMSQKSLKDLFAMSKDQECVYSDASGNSGSVFTSGGKVRGDFVSSSADVSTTSHMIMDGETSYIWMDGQTQGYKMSINANDSENIETSEKVKESVDLNQKLDYRCDSWRADSSVFVLPDNVTFVSMDDFALPSAPDNTSQCATCDSLPESAKAQCKTALGC